MTNTTVTAVTRFETLLLDRSWHDRYSISARERFASLLDATASAFEVIVEDTDCGCRSFDAIRIWDRADDRLIAEWEYCCDDAEPDGEGGMVGLGYAWTRIR